MPTYINYRNTRVAYTSTGSGSAVVLLHGFLENLGMWKAFIPQLSKRYRIICIDLLGHGNSGNIGYVHTMEEQARAVKAVLKHLRLRRVTLIGHSMGGYVSLAFTELFLSNIKGLCLLNSTAMADPPDKKKNRDRAIAAVKQNPGIFISMAIPNLFAVANRGQFSNEIRQLTQEAQALPSRSIIAALEGMKIRKDRTAIWHENGFKKVLILGREDPVLNYKTLLRQAKNAPVELIELPGGHMSHFENKTSLLNILKEFVKSCN